MEKRGEYELLSDDGPPIAVVPPEQTSRFATLIYKYFDYGGYRRFVWTNASQLFNNFFLCFMFTFATSCIDYGELLSYQDDTMFRFTDVVHVYGLVRPSLLNIVMYPLYATLLAWRINRFFHEFGEMRGMRRFYVQCLGISDESVIPNLQWSAVADAVEHYHRQARDGEQADVFASDTELLTPHNLANRIMRKENYMMAMFEQRVVRLGYKHWTMNTSFEWAFWFSLWLHPTRNRAIHLYERTTVVIIVYVLFMPLILLYSVLYTLVHAGDLLFNTTQSKSANSFDIAQKTWTVHAKYRFREYNELPHIFHARVENARKHLNKYLQYWTNSYYNAIFASITIVCGSVVLLLLVLALINDNVLLYMEITRHRSTLWVVSVLTTVLGVAKHQSKPTQTLHLQEKVEALQRLLPGKIRYENCYSSVFRNKVANNLEYRITYVLKNILGVIITPYLLYRHVLRNTHEIETFIEEHSSCIDNTTFYVCSYANDMKNRGTASEQVYAEYLV